MKLWSKGKKLYTAIYNLYNNQFNTNSPNFLIGKMMAELNAAKEKINSIQDVEFKVFSQWGDDGIIQYLVSKLPIKNKTFVEFGVEYYTESNTRFLLLNNNWRGLVIDGSDEHINYIKNDSIYWQYELHVRKAFITAENIESLIDEAGFETELGILSIDIDGNDYSVWKAIRKYNPDIVIVEYNSAYGDNPWITPYDPNFVREQAGPKKLFWGASLLSLCDLADEKGYDFIGCNQNGNNAYFVKRSVNNNTFKPLSYTEGFIESKFREVFHNGVPINANQKLQFLKGITVFNTRENKTEII